MPDTNIVSPGLRAPDRVVARRVETVGSDKLCINALVASEFRYGAVKKRSERLSSLIENILEPLDIVDYGAAATTRHADIRDQLARDGHLIGPMDLLIAAHARSLDSSLVTDNTGRFSRVHGLTPENWISDQEKAP